MRSVILHFSGEEFNKLDKLKKELDLSWEKFVFALFHVFKISKELGEEK